MRILQHEEFPAYQSGREFDAAKEEKRGGTVFIASGDRDTFQLASDRTTILYPVRAGEMARVGPAEVRARYGVDPKQVPDFIALRGGRATSVRPKLPKPQRRAHLRIPTLISRALPRKATSNSWPWAAMAAKERAVKLANENADAAFKLAKDVAQAKDLQELIDLQTRYVQSQMKWYAYQSQEFGRLMAKAISDTKKTQS